MKQMYRRHSRNQRGSQEGLTLLETVIALALLFVVAAGVMTLAGTALSTTETQGHLMARTAEYAQDKMEQLLALKFCDATSDTTVVPTNPAGGKGLAGCAAPLNNNGTGAGGNSNPNVPVAGYVDYLDVSGNLLPPGTPGWRYIRVWQISSANAANTLKQITVTVKVSSEVGNGALPQSTVTSLKSYPF